MTKKSQKPIRCALYDRVSTDMQVEKGLSLEAQEQALRDYADSMGYIIVDTYRDEGLTARKKMSNRKELQRLLKDVEADKIDLILVTKLDRWFRNIKDYHNTQAILEAHHCNWKTIFEEYDTTTSNGRFAINIMLSVNENECDRDSDRQKEIFKYQISVGKCPVSTLVYFGYKRDENKRLIFDEDTKHIVEFVYDEMFQCHSKHTVYKKCLERFGNVFSYQTFKHFFTAEIYKGCYSFNKHFCPAYLTAEQWDALQDINKRNIKLYQGKKRSNIYLFTGLLKCPECGRGLAGNHVVSHGKVMKYYRCWKHRVDRSCSYGSMVSEIWLESYLKNNLEYELFVDKTFNQAKHTEKILPMFDVAKHKKELERLNSMYLKGRISEERYDEEYMRIKKILEEHSDDSIPEEKPRDFSKINAVLNNDWPNLYESLDMEHKRSFWHGIIQKIEFVDNRKIKHITFL